jgi:hypothetical protein
LYAVGLDEFEYRLISHHINPAVAGLLSMAKTAESSANVADVVSDEVGRSALNSKYSNGPWGRVQCTRFQS